MIVLGIDPGVSGGIAFYDTRDPLVIRALDTPVVAGEVDVDSLVDIIISAKPDRAIIERVHSMPKQGVASTFKFGTAYGAVRATVVALRIPTTLVTPRVWKQRMGLNSEAETSRARAIQRWPGAGCFTRKKDHNRAEAALLALYAVEADAAPLLERAA